MRGNILLIFINLFFGANITITILLKNELNIIDATIFVCAFVLAFYLEYKSHSGPMHFKKDSKIYINHAVRHHNFFDHMKMYYTSSKDYDFTLNQPKIILMNTIINVYLPGGIFYLIHHEYGLTYFLAGFFYFYINEMLHFYYHLNSENFIVRVSKIFLPFVYTMRKHHQLHHNKKNMDRFNFGISSSLFDYIFRTKLKE